MKDIYIRNSTVELNKTVMHQRNIPGQKWGGGRSPSKISEEGKTVDTYGEEKERIRKDKGVFLTGGGETTNPENMETLYAFLRSQGMEE